MCDIQYICGFNNERMEKGKDFSCLSTSVHRKHRWKLRRENKNKNNNFKKKIKMLGTVPRVDIVIDGSIF